MKAFIREHLLAVSIVLSVSIYSLWPVLQDPHRRVVDKWDGVLMVWYLNQTIRKIPDNLAGIFQANIFYPYENVLAYSDMHIPSAFISSIPTVITKEPLVALGTSLLFGQVATVLVCYLWFWEVTKNKTAALISSIALGVSLTRMSFIVHLQMWNHQWWLLSVYLFWKYFRKQKFVYLLLSAVFWGLQMWESPLGVYFAGFVMILLGIKNFGVVLKRKKEYIYFIFLSAVIMFLPLRAYIFVSKEFGYVRTIRDTANFAIGIDALLKSVFTDGVFLVLVILILIKLRKEILKEKWLWVVLFAGLVLSLGPVLKVGGKTFKILDKIFIPLPYGILYYVVPGFSAFRAPGRWLWIGLFAASFLFCIGLSEFIKAKKCFSQNLLLLTVIIIVLFPIGKRISFYDFGDVGSYPKVYSYLKTLPTGVLLEVPIYSWAHGDIASVEDARMVYSLYHDKYLLGGISGFEPKSFDKVRDLYWQAFPGDEFDNLIKKDGVNYLIVWKGLLDKEKLNEIEKYYGFSEYNDDTHVLYKY